MSARDENASRSAPHPTSARGKNTRLKRRIRFLSLLTLMIPEYRRERPDQTGTDRLSAEPAEPEGERHRAPHIRFELHRLERHLQARQPRRRIAPEGEPRFVALDQHRLQTGPGAQR